MKLVAFLIFMVSAASGASAGQALLPSYDVTRSCRTQVDYAYAATLGQFDVPREMQACTAREQDQRGSVEALWPLASETDRTDCLTIAEERYSYLARCLAGSRSVRAAR